VFSQSLISLDLIEDFLELATKAKDDDEIVSPYKGKLLGDCLMGPLIQEVLIIHMPVNVLTILYQILWLPMISFPF